MKQVYFDGKGKLIVADVPAPALPTEGALIQVHASLISSGTELSQASGGGNLIRKALAEPALIGRAFQLALREGLRFTAQSIRDVSETWLPTGYSSAGVIIQSRGARNSFRTGDRVACAGAGYANHAEVNAVPSNLMAVLPPDVSYEQAAFATVGAIALQGVRRSEATLGEHVVVVGLGLIGQLTAQLLSAAGCQVIGIDPLAPRRELAARLAGAEPIDPEHDPIRQVMALTRGVGADRVLLCAGTRSSEPTNQAFQMCRERGRVVMVGAMGMDLERTDFYNRELDFVISRSAGPGRYDPNYEEKGIDYPLGYVRWTEQRNMAAFLGLVASGKVDVNALVSATYPIEAAADAYEAVRNGALGVMLTYEDEEERGEQSIAQPFLLRAQDPRAGKVGLALVGAGSFAKSTHLPNLKASAIYELRAVVSGSASATQLGERERIPLITTDLGRALADPSVSAVLIATRHALHAPQAIQAAEAGKHIFVEKPLALTVDACQAIIDAADAAGVLLTVGFNRRLAPATLALTHVLSGLFMPKTVLYRINAGAIPVKHWLNDPEQGGGRLLGEGVHFIDFICGLIGHDPLDVSAEGSADGQDFVIVLRFADESIGTIIYTARGDVSQTKEKIEVFTDGGLAIIEDFRTLRLHNLAGKETRGKPDKGHRALLNQFGLAIQGKCDLPVTGYDGLRATRIALAALESMRSGRTMPLAQATG